MVNYRYVVFRTFVTSKYRFTSFSFSKNMDLVKTNGTKLADYKATKGRGHRQRN